MTYKNEPRFQVVIARDYYGWRDKNKYAWRFCTANNRTVCYSLDRFESVEDCILGIKVFQSSLIRARFTRKELADGWRLLYRIDGSDVAVGPIRRKFRWDRVLSQTLIHLPQMRDCSAPIRVQCRYRGRVK